MKNYYEERKNAIQEIERIIESQGTTNKFELIYGIQKKYGFSHLFVNKTIKLLINNNLVKEEGDFLIWRKIAPIFKSDQEISTEAEAEVLLKDQQLASQREEPIPNEDPNADP